MRRQPLFMSLLARIYWIDAQIRGGHYPNAETVCRQFEVSRRTAYNDHAYLRDRLHAPVRFDEAHNGWAYSDPAYLLPALALSEKQSLTLRRSLLAAQEYLGPQQAEPVRLLLTWMEESVTPSLPPDHERVRGSIHLTPGISHELLEVGARAVARRQRLRLLYYSPHRHERTERIVQPYDLLYWRGEPHLIAFCELRQAIRQFFLGRVIQWQVLEPEGAFARDPTFDIEAYLARGLDLRHGEELVMVRVRFSAHQARWVRERRYHKSQQIEELPDGGLLLTLRVAGTEEVRRWLLGYGAEAEVLEPETLRDEIREAVEKLRKIYAG